MTGLPELYQLVHNGKNIIYINWDGKGRVRKTLNTKKLSNCTENQRGLEKLYMLKKDFDDYLQNLSDENKLTLIKSCKQEKDKSTGDIKDKLFNNFR